MKTRRFFLLYSATVLCWLPFIEVAAENLSDSSLKDLKQEEISDSKVEQYDNDVENNEKSPLIRQKQLIKSNSNNKSNSYFALNQLTENSIIVTSESLDAIERDAESALVRVDIYEGANLPIAISKSLEKLFSEKEERYTDLISVINSNKKLFSSITELRDALDNLSLYDHMDFDNEKYSEAYGTVLTAFSDVIAEIFKDEKVQSVNYFVDFITLSKKFTDLAFVRYHTEKMLSKIRSTLEGISGIKTNVNATLSVNVPVPIPNMSVNLDLFTNGEAYGSSSTSFYTITKTKGAKAGVTFNIAPLKISGKLSLERAASTLFYSLEAYMDYINETHVPSLNKLKAFSIKGMNDSLKERKNLQEKEKDVLANNGMFERYLRMFGAMPNVGASLIWIDITKAKAKDKATETTISEEISANVSVPLSSIGLTLKASQGLKTYTKTLPLLSLINEDCSTVVGLTTDDLTELIGKKNDLSENILDSNFMLGMLQGYLFTLERLAVTKLDSERKEYEEKKHYYEGILSPKKKIGNVGREGVLRSCILTAAILREKAPKDQDQGRRFRKVYEQLVKLSKLSEFSKNKTGIRKAVGYGKTANTDADITSKINNLTASFNVEAPYVGTVTASASRKTIKGSPFIYENGKFMSLTVSLPIYSSGVVGLAVVRERFKSVFDKASDKKLSINLDDFKDIAKGFGIVKGVDKAAAVLSNLGSPAGISASGSADFTFNWRCTPHLKDSSKLIPLPGEKLIKNDKDRWSLDSVVVLKKINAGINTSGKIVDVPVSVKASASIGKQSKIVGSDTFNDTLGKANVFALGIVDSKSGESTQMSSMLKKRSKQFVKMFKRIASMDSNAAIELQDAYNKIMNHCDSSEEKTECEQLFRDFIAGCKKLAKNGTENGDANSGEEETAELLDEEDAGKKNELKSLDTKEIKQTLDLFGKILNKYYIHVFKPFYDQSFSVVNEEENTEEEDYLPNQNIAESK